MTRFGDWLPEDAEPAGRDVVDVRWFENLNTKTLTGPGWSFTDGEGSWYVPDE